MLTVPVCNAMNERLFIMDGRRAPFVGAFCPRTSRHYWHRRPPAMTRSLVRSNAHFRKALTRLPLGVSSNFPYWGDEKTIYVAGARGARLKDIDGNEYIDYRMAYGPCILGYADPRVDAAAG